jgi:hypothetical protein
MDDCAAFGRVFTGEPFAFFGRGTLHHMHYRNFPWSIVQARQG